MLMDSDSGLNFGLGFDNSFQNVLMRTMVNQEEIFKNQVLELHRLYEIQKILMEEDYKLSSGETPQSSVGPFRENLDYKSLATKTKLSHLSEGHTICSSGSVQNHCLKEHRVAFEHPQISLDLNLASSQYTNESGNLSRDCATPNFSSLIKLGIYNDAQSSIDMLKLSLRAGAATWPKSSGRKTCKDRIIFSPPRQDIRLEGSTNTGAHTTIPTRGYAAHSGAKNEFEASCSFTSQKNDVFGWIQESQSPRDGRTNLLEWKHFYQGVEQCHEESCENMPARRKLFASHEVGELDLNKALPDESSVHTIASWIFNPLHCTSSGVSHNEVGDNGKDNIITVLDQRKLRNNYSFESSALARQDTTVSTLTISPRKDTSELLCKSTFCSLDFGSVCGPLSDSTDHGSGSKNFRPENTESEIHFPEKICRKIPVFELNVKKKKEDKLCLSQELLEGTDSNRSPVSCKSDLITDDESSNTKTVHCLIDMPNSNVSQNVMVPFPEKKSQPSDPKKEESAEVDPAVKKGAVSLILFSLECSVSARNQDYGSESKKRKESCNAEREVPQTSSDSYESMVLKQPECSIDEYCVSSKPSEITGLDEKNRGIKLKRGRRMKDFRKEILPGLASLSRQEINEDIKIMELALRSREYKKYRSKTASRSDSIAPVRSRRSRPRYVGQRYYS